MVDQSMDRSSDDSRLRVLSELTRPTTGISSNYHLLIIIDPLNDRLIIRIRPSSDYTVRVTVAPYRQRRMGNEQ